MRAVATLFVFAIIFLPAGASADEMQRPQLHPGDEWDVAVTTPYGAYVAKRIVVGPESVDTPNGTLSLTKIVEVNHDLPNGTDPTSVAGQRFPFARVTDVVWLDADGKTWREMRPSPNGMTTMDWPGGCDLDGYPLVAGEGRGNNCQMRQDGGAVQPSGSYTRATVSQDVTVPAGTFHTIVAYHAPTGQASEAQWYAPEACWRVQTDTPDHTVAMKLLGYKCGAAAGGKLFEADPALDLAAIGHTPVKPSPGPGALILGCALILGALVMRRAKRS